jgi:hypothetical protein
MFYPDEFEKDLMKEGLYKPLRLGSTTIESSLHGSDPDPGARPMQPHRSSGDPPLLKEPFGADLRKYSFDSLVGSAEDELRRAHPSVRTTPCSDDSSWCCLLRSRAESFLFEFGHCQSP